MSLPCCVVERCVTEFILQNSHTVINQPVVPGNDKLLRWKWGYPTPAYGYSLILTAFPTFSIWSLAVFVLQAIKTGGRKALGTRLQVCRFGCGYYRREMVRRGLGTLVYTYLAVDHNVWNLKQRPGTFYHRRYTQDDILNQMMCWGDA